MPIKIYKDKVEIPNGTELAINGTVKGLDASKIGAATTSQLNSLSTTVSNLSATVSNLSTTVSDLSATVSENYSTLYGKFSNYLLRSGGELTGNLTIKGTTGNTWIRALNDYSTIYLEAASSGTRGIWDSGKNAWIVSVDTNNNVSLNGNAATASKLNTDAGSTTKPVYFSGGIPKECGASLAVSITGSSASCTGNANSATTATTANKVSKALTINSTSYDGSAAVTITVPTFSYNSTTKTLTITG